MIATLPAIVGTPPYGTPTSISPFVPKVSIGVPVAAESEIIRDRAMTTMRGSAVAVPGQYATPRVETAPPAGPSSVGGGSVHDQISAAVPA